MAEKETHILYGGDVEIDFYPNSHRYKKKGDKNYLISVTSVTGQIDKSRFLMPWAVRLAGQHMRKHIEEHKGPYSTEELYPIIDEAVVNWEKEKDVAASIGNVVHQYAQDFAQFKVGKADEPSIENYFSMETDEENEKVVNGISAFLDWYNSNDVKFINPERLIYSKEYEYTGKCDVPMELNGKLTVGDYKTGKGIYEESYYQLSGYWGALEEEDGISYEQGVILHFDKESGRFAPYYTTPEEHKNLLFPAFLNLLDFKKKNKELSKKLYAKKSS